MDQVEEKLILVELVVLELVVLELVVLELVEKKLVEKKLVEKKLELVVQVRQRHVLLLFKEFVFCNEVRRLERP